MRIGVLFPGQGAQFVGMGAEAFAARPDLLGERATDILGWSLVDVCSQGPEDKLTLTEHAQLVGTPLSTNSSTPMCWCSRSPRDPASTLTPDPQSSHPYTEAE